MKIVEWPCPILVKVIGQFHLLFGHSSVWLFVFQCKLWCVLQNNPAQCWGALIVHCLLQDYEERPWLHLTESHLRLYLLQLEHISFPQLHKMCLGFSDEKENIFLPCIGLCMMLAKYWGRYSLCFSTFSCPWRTSDNYSGSWWSAWNMWVSLPLLCLSTVTIWVCGCFCLVLPFPTSHVNH